MPRTMPIVTLSEMSPGQEADLFLLMTAKEELKTKTGKPYFRVGFRDGGREVSFPIWGDSPWAVDCRDRWTPGVFYKAPGASTRRPTSGRSWKSARSARWSRPTPPTASTRRSACRDRGSIRSRCSTSC